MTNWEKYKSKLYDMLVDTIAVNKATGEPMQCFGGLECKSCIFDNSDNCAESVKRWLGAEPPKDTLEVATLISYLKMEPNQMKQVKSIKIVDGMPVINGGE